jgi:uncharacterized protein (TIGR00251 family)
MGNPAPTEEHADGSLLHLRVRPRAGRNEIGGVHEGRLRVFVTVPPEKGKANAAVIRLLANQLRCPTGSLEIVRGQTGRDKSVLCRGLSATEVTAGLGIQAKKNRPEDGL